MTSREFESRSRYRRICCEPDVLVEIFTVGLNEGSHANAVWASVCETMPGQEGSREQLTDKRTQE